jgi:indolepyruvate ferredoxin oxidoreductase
MMPILNPAGVQEIIDYSGCYGFALSRFASNLGRRSNASRTTSNRPASVDGSIDRVKIVRSPDDFVMPPGGLSIRRELDFLDQELRLHLHKRAAAFSPICAPTSSTRPSSLGRPRRASASSPSARAYLDVRQALDELGLDEVRANDIGIRLFKIGCPWPLDPQAS